MTDRALNDQHPSNDAEKAQVETREDVHHRGQFTEGEVEIAKKLRRKIDMRIMPLVILVYLMNYIDRYAQLAR